MNIYEYLFAGLIVVLLLTASTVMVATISTPANNAADKNQLSIVAQKVMTQMMLDSGYPTNWGSIDGSVNDKLKVFGLAQSGETSREAYELDPDKVLRLESSNPGYFPPNRALDLLNLDNAEGAAEYGFTLQFNDAIHINNPTELGPAYADNYTITVTSEYDLPVSGADVSATLYYINNATTPSTISHLSTLHGSTGYDGSYNANYNTKTVTAKILSVTVNYYGVQATKLYNLTNGPQATLYQNQLLANINQHYSVPNDGDAKEILVASSGETTDLTVSNDGPPDKFIVNGSIEPTAVGVLAISGAAHDQLILATRDFSHISYQTINFQNSPVPAGDFTYSLERTVVIGGSVYTATLYLWRMTF